jgi:hypothetical protein
MDEVGMPVRLKIPTRHARMTINRYRFNAQNILETSRSDWTVDPEVVAWIGRHAPSATIDYSRGQPVVSFGNEREAFEFKVRWF